MQNSILTNIASLKIRNNMNIADNKLSYSLRRMSSGLKILNSKDDASGVVISSKMNARLNGLNSVSGNIQRGMSFLNTAESAYTEISDILSRLRDLSLQASNETNDIDSLNAINDEANELTNELKRIQTSTKFSDIKLFDNYIEESTTPTTPTPAPIATTSLDDEPIPMMMSMRSTPQEYTISFGANETKTLNINGIDYQIINTTSNAQNFKYSVNEDEITTLHGSYFRIIGDENKAHNVIISGYSNEFYGGNQVDKIAIKGDATTIRGNGGDDIVSFETNSELSFIDLNDGNDTIVTNGFNIQNSTILGGGDNNKIIGGNSLSNCYLQGFSENDNKEYVKLTARQIKTVTIGGKNFQIGNPLTSSNVISWSYDKNSDKVTFTGTSLNVRALSDAPYNIDVRGNDIIIYGGEKDDTITVISGKSPQVYGNGGNDTIINSEVVRSCNIEGGNGDDTIIGNAKGGRYIGGEGDDTIVINGAYKWNNSSVQNGGNGNDTYEIGDSTIIQDNSGENTYYINKDDVTLTTGTSSDTFYINADDVEVNTTGGDNKFVVNGNNNTIATADGDDNFEIYGNNNTIDGGLGKNKVKTDGNNNFQNISEFSIKTPLNITLQVGAEAGQSFDIDLDFSLAGFNLDFSSSQGARNNISKIDNLIDEVNMELSKIGATMNRLESAIQLQEIETVNLSQTKSLITDCDMANEAAEFAKTNIMQEVASSLFSQANQLNSNLIMGLLNFNF